MRANPEKGAENGGARPLKVLLADDDKDDRFLFDLVLARLGRHVKLTTVNNGQQLLDHLDSNEDLPDVIFLDLNMPLKNGNECLAVIKSNPRLRHLPVVIYSTSMREEIADILYEKGAAFYLQKTDTYSLVSPLLFLLDFFGAGPRERPGRKQFILNSAGVEPFTS